jgi:hypothetical protein
MKPAQGAFRASWVGSRLDRIKMFARLKNLKIRAKLLLAVLPLALMVVLATL